MSSMQENSRILPKLKYKPGHRDSGAAKSITLARNAAPPYFHRPTPCSQPSLSRQIRSHQSEARVSDDVRRTEREKRWGIAKLEPNAARGQTQLVVLLSCKGGSWKGVTLSSLISKRCQAWRIS